MKQAKYQPVHVLISQLGSQGTILSPESATKTPMEQSCLTRPGSVVS